MPNSLDQRHLDHLTASAIAPDVIAERGYYSLAPGDTSSAAALLGVKPSTVKPAMHDGAMVIPLRRRGDKDPCMHVLRPDRPASDAKGRPRKYLFPAGQTNILDALPRHHDALGDPGRPLWFTEGAKKCDALASAFGDLVAVVNLNGVHGWRAKNQAGGKVVTPDLHDLAFNGREVILCPDGDYKTNPGVQKAISELARYLQARYSVAAVWLCVLPQNPHGDKLGVDDYLARGGTTADLLTMLQPLVSARASTTDTFMPHPDTGAPLVLPHGYSVVNQAIVKVPAWGPPQPVYTGAIFVRATGVDLQTGRHTLTIAWTTPEGLRERTIGADLLSNRRAFSEQIGGSGATVHEGNIKQVMSFLGEFAPANRSAIPRRLESTSYGLVGNGLVLADRSVGFDEPVTYADTPRITAGSDAEAYPRAIREAAGWDSAAFWLTLALGLAGPIIARMRPRRNPVLGLFGESGGGKTTVAMFATGCFGTPSVAPLKLEAGRSTTAGLFQSLERLGGLPLLIDEAHTHPQPARLSGDVYQFANGQSYTRGGTDGRARGGVAISGALILCAEAIPEFRHAGARNRVLFVATDEHRPLAADRLSELGEARARILERAWDAGAGLFGARVLETVWRDWGAFRGDVETWRNSAQAESLGPWRDAVAIAAATLGVALGAAGVTAIAGADSLIDRWTDMLRSGHERTDPAGDAFERLLLMLAQADARDDSYNDAMNSPVPASWEYLEADRGGGVIACRRIGESFWRVPTATPQFIDRVGPSAVQEFGREWVRRGLIDCDGEKTTSILRLYPRGQARSLRIPCDVVAGKV